jgi:ATP-dependent helicase/nuclease subunit A
LLSKAAEFDKRFCLSLREFLDFLEGDALGSFESGEGGEEAGESVKLMSVHKSKGLEFPIVILAGCGKNFNFSDLSESFLCHEKYGFGFDYIDIKRRASYQSTAKTALKIAKRREQLSEEARLLYVALTRSREKLIIIGSLNLARAKKLRENYGSLEATKSIGAIPAFMVAGSRSFIEWLILALASHPDFNALRERFGVSENFVDAAKKYDVNLQIFTVGEDDENEGNQGACGVFDGQNPANSLAPKALPEADEAKCFEQKLPESPNLPNTHNSTTQGDPTIPPNLANPTNLANLTNITNSVDPTNPKAPHEADEKGCFLGNSAEPPEPAKMATTFDFADNIKFFETAKSFARVPLKISASEIGAKKPANFVRFSNPEPLKVAEFSAAEVGTITHFVMKNINLTRIKNGESARKLIAEMTESGALPQKEAAAIDSESIEKFFKSEIGRRVLASKKVERELSLSGLLPGNVFGEEFAPDAEILTRGIIDCLFWEDDSIVLIDYKTDAARGTNVQKLAEAYAPQLDVYARLAKMILKPRSVEKFLYFFAASEVIRV